MHPFLFFVFSTFFCFSTFAEETSSAPSLSPGWGDCSESYLNKVCGGGEKKESTSSKPEPKLSENQNRMVTDLPNEDQKKTSSKICSDREARTCCADPTTCLGGEALSTFNEINNIVTQVGPGLASMLQGFGKDMSRMCETMQGLAASGASVALAASTRCKVSISSCRSNCDYQIKKVECEKYKNQANTCRTTKAQCSHPMHAQMCKKQEENRFQTEVLPIFKQVQRHEETQLSCLAQKEKAKDISNNIAQMANSAISSELCKQQARHTEDKESCEKKEGHKWVDGECQPPEEEEKPTDTVAFDTKTGDQIISHSPGSLGTPTVESPLKATTEEDPNGNGKTSGGGGGGNIQTAGGDSPFDGIDLPDSSSPFSGDSETESGTTTAAQQDREDTAN